MKFLDEEEAKKAKEELEESLSTESKIITGSSYECLDCGSILKTPIDKLISILNPDDPEQFRIDISDPETILCTMYQSGLNTGQYNLDIQEFKLKQIETDKAKLEYDEYCKTIKLRNDLFGV